MLTLITVNYKNAKATLGLLRSLERQRVTDFDVIVVDNDSGEADREILGEYAATTSLNLDIIYSETNRGFSGGNNLAIRKAMAQKSEWLLLINNDTTVEPDFVALLALPHQKHALIGLPLREEERVAYAGNVSWLRSTLSHVHSFPPATSVAYAIGAGMLVHRSIFERVGLLDERYFLYFEDADFSLRVHAKGLPLHFLQAPVIVHRVSESTRALGSPLLLRYHIRNALLFNMRHGPWWARITLPLWSLFGILTQFGKLLLMPSRRAESRAIVAGIIDFYANHFGHIQETHHHRN